MASASSNFPPELGTAPSVAHIADCYVNGSENWIHTQVSHLRDHAPFVLTGQTNNLDQFDWRPPYYKTFGRPMSVRAFDKIGRYLLNYRPTLRWKLQEQGAELIHAHFGPTGYSILPLAEACGLPTVTTFYGYDLSRLPQSEPEWRRRYDELFDQGSHFLVEGSHMKQKLVDLGCPEEKVTVHHIGVKVDDLPYQPRHRDDGDPLRILMAGRFTEKKGFPYAIDAFARFLENGGDGELTLIGGSRSEQAEREFRTALRKRAAGHGIEDAVHLRGFLPYADLIQAYLDHHVFLSPSVEAENGDNEGGAPVTLIEASATGMPIVSTFHCDIPEVVVDGKTGLLAKERDVSTLAVHLETLSRNPDRIHELGSAGRKRIEEEYSAEVQGYGLDNIYSDIIRE